MSIRDGSRVDVPLPRLDEDPEHVPLLFLLLTTAQARQVSVGRVPGEVREMARLLADETQEELRKNAAKPVRLAKQKGASRRG
jgi:hypothetical protein